MNRKLNNTLIDEDIKSNVKINKVLQTQKLQNIDSSTLGIFYDIVMSESVHHQKIAKKVTIYDQKEDELEQED